MAPPHHLSPTYQVEVGAHAHALSPTTSIQLHQATLFLRDSFFDASSERDSALIELRTASAFRRSRAGSTIPSPHRRRPKDHSRYFRSYLANPPGLTYWQTVKRREDWTQTALVEDRKSAAFLIENFGAGRGLYLEAVLLWSGRRINSTEADGALRNA